MRSLKQRLKQYLEDAAVRQAARDRLPGWAKALVPTTALLFISGSTALLIVFTLPLHDLLHGGAPRRQPDVAVVLILAASFVTAIIPGLVLANYALWLIPPIRRTLEQNSRGVPGASFKAANRALLKVARFSIPVGLVALVVGVIDLWAN